MYRKGGYKAMRFNFVFWFLWWFNLFSKL